MDAAADRIEEKPGPIDVRVNAAFSTVFAPVAESRPEELRRTTEVTYFGFVHGTQAALRRMLPRDRGTIVQVGPALDSPARRCAAGGVLRGQARHPGLHRVPALRAAARPQRVRVTWSR
ncbi:hypothetical protein GCM10010279_26930 [Streptomyces mutabilis]|nr:hypothetical protein GCM10010279_26930 [Streptomyces mutabilis]